MRVPGLRRSSAAVRGRTGRCSAVDKKRLKGGGGVARVAVVTGGTRASGRDLEGAERGGCTVAANYGGNDEAAQKFKAETGIPVYKWTCRPSRPVRPA